MRRWNVAQAALWSVLLIGFVAIGAPRFWHAVRDGRTLPATADSSMDSFFSVIERNHAYAVGLSGLFRSLPANKRVVIFQAAGRTEASFVGMAMAYLAWPHPVEFVPVSPATAKQLVHYDVASAGVFVSCGLPLPPHMAPAIALSPTVQIFLAPENVATR